jgi:acyl carrier protein
MKVSRDEIEKELKTLLCNIVELEPEDIKPNAHFFQDLGIDSIKAIEITVAIEKKFKVSIREEDVEKITTLAKAVDIISDALDKK